MIYSEKADEWKQFILDCQSSGMTIQQYCDDNKVNIHTYYYWLRRLRRMSCDIPEKKQVKKIDLPQAIVPLTFPNESIEISRTDTSSTAVILHLNSITMEIRNGASEAIIRNTIHALNYVR